MKWYLFILRSSAGKKMLMAITGVSLMVFLGIHLLGNTLAFVGSEAFNDYAQKLHSLEPFLTLFNVGLLTIGLVHILIGAILFVDNLKARPIRYEMYKNPGGRTIGSDTMPYTGFLILLFVFVHLLKFTFVDKSTTPIYQLMVATFSNPGWVGAYLFAAIVVAVHVSHGFWSVFQTLGLNHPHHMPVIMKLGILVTIVFGIGFGALPLFLFTIR